MRATPQTEAGVRAALQELTDAYQERDPDRVMAMLGPDDDLVLIGTGPDECRMGRAEVRLQLERDFCQSEALAAEYQPLMVSEAGSVAWAVGTATARAIVDGFELVFVGRFTAVLERLEGTWRFMHLHFSVPAADQDQGSSF